MVPKFRQHFALFFALGGSWVGVWGVVWVSVLCGGGACVVLCVAGCGCVSLFIKKVGTLVFPCAYSFVSGLCNSAVSCIGEWWVVRKVSILRDCVVGLGHCNQLGHCVLVQSAGYGGLYRSIPSLPPTIRAYWVSRGVGMCGDRRNRHFNISFIPKCGIVKHLQVRRRPVNIDAT